MNFWEDLRTFSYSYYEWLLGFLPRFIIGLVFIALMWLLAGRAKRALNSRLNKTMDDPLLANFLAQILKVVLVILGLLMGLGIMGLGGAAGGLLAGAGVSAFIIGFAFKDIGENFLAGIIMAFDRPFRIGDVVELAGHTGKIIGLTLRDTHMKTFDGKDVYVPNGMIVRNPIVNLTIDGFLRNEFNLRLGMSASVDEAVQITHDTLLSISGILSERAPNIFLSDFTAGGMTLMVQYWFNTDDPNVSSLAIKTQAISQVIKALTEAGFSLPTNRMEVQVKQG